MKTLRKDGINEKLLLETYAYIVTHESIWAQGSWRTVDTNAYRCKTPMCFAGHAAITLGGGKDVVPFPKPAIWKAVKDGTATPEQSQIIHEWYATSDYLLATKAEIDAGDVITTSVDGVDVKVVEIMDRAERLLGHNAVADNLFGGSNDIEDIRSHIAGVLDITEEKLDEKARKIATANHWRMPKAIDAEHITGWEG